MNETVNKNFGTCGDLLRVLSNAPYEAALGILTEDGTTTDLNIIQINHTPEGVTINFAS